MSNPIYGMQFGTDALHNPSYSTLQKRLQINLNNPYGKQFNVVSVPGGTNFSVDESQVQSATEQLFTVTHGLGYIPQTYVVFSQIPIGSNQTAASSGYDMEQITIASSAVLSDTITYIVNTTTLTVNHTVSSIGGGSASYTSTAANYTLQIKYLICNNPQIRTTVFH